MNVTPLRRTTLSEAILEQLSDLIITGRLQAGDRLPTERELAQQFGVARGPVREALRALALIGLVEIKQGHGIFVRNRTGPWLQSIAGMVATAVDDIRHVYHARRVIESELMVLAATKASPGQIASLQQLMAAMRDIETHRPADAEEFAALHYQFDLVVAEAAGNPILLDIFKSIRQVEVETHLKVLRLPESMRNSVLQHGSILAAIEHRDAQAAAAAAETHFRSIEPILQGLAADRAVAQDPGDTAVMARVRA